jgi:hypothetical protein
MPFPGFFRLDHSGTEKGHNATHDKHIPQLVEYVCNRLRSVYEKVKHFL